VIRPKWPWYATKGSSHGSCGENLGDHKSFKFSGLCHFINGWN
jgi:hypothetical protein